MTRLIAPLLAAVCVLIVAGCSGPPQASGREGGGPSARDAREGEGGPAAPAASVAAFETFDAARYPVAPPKRATTVDHRVPDRLLSNRADKGVTRTVQGFRIQVFSAQDKQAAESFREKVRRWWQRSKGDAPSDLFSSTPPIVIEYAQPYYRVRFGAFARREDAEDALRFVRQTYPDAFMARTTVTVVR